MTTPFWNFIRIHYGLSLGTWTWNL